ncbi:TetR/AcrR family transcriptional regulator [Candidatus Poribacteria bacterium]|nr:TetR/AcrR family transcriptional regulator [Candidatus Poribacteria bacterium]
MGRKSLANERRAEIAHGLYRCIAKRGYANTSVRDIAKEANIGLGMITHYFKSKEEILYVMTENTYKRYWKMFMLFSRKHQKKAVRERLRLSLEFLFMRVAGDKEKSRVFRELMNISQHDEYLLEFLREHYRKYRALVAEALLEMLPDQDREDTPIRDLSAFLVAATEGAALLCCVEPRRISLKRLSSIATRLVDSMLENEHCEADRSVIKGKGNGGSGGQRFARGGLR